jgi:hypothetical protein
MDTLKKQSPISFKQSDIQFVFRFARCQPSGIRFVPKMKNFQQTNQDTAKLLIPGREKVRGQGSQWRVSGLLSG